MAFNFISRRKWLKSVAVAALLVFSSPVSAMLFSGLPSFFNSLLRNPTVNDDASRGNIIGRLWLNTLTGQFFTCSDTTNGAAVWVDAGTPTAFPGDAVAGVIACYGTKPLKASWINSNLFKIQRKSDNAQQIIVAIAGVPDFTTFNSFTLGTVCQVIIEYDQSGNGYDRVQNTIANAPWIRLIGNEFQIVYDYYSNASNPIRSLNFPAIAWGNNISVFAMASTTTQRPGVLALWELGIDTSNFEGLYNTQFGGWVDQAGLQGTLSIDTGNIIWSLRSTASNATAGCGERSYTSSNWKTKGSPVGGIIGTTAQKSGGPYPFDGTSTAWLAWSSSLSDANALLVRKALYQWSGTGPQADNDFFVFDGDSHMSGDAGTFPAVTLTTGPHGYNQLIQARPFYNRPIREINLAKAGYKLADCITRYPDDIKPLFNANARNNILFINAAINDPYIEGDATTPAVVLARLNTYCTTAKADGWKVYVLTCCTVADNGALTYPVADWITNYNILLRANIPINCEGLIDVGANVIFDAPPDYDNTIYYDPDKHHFSAIGYGVYSNYIKLAINAKLGSI